VLFSICFELLKRDYAERFDRGFGGNVINFASAQNTIKDAMAL
jgi:hypothetical protein